MFLNLKFSRSHANINKIKKLTFREGVGNFHLDNIPPFFRKYFFLFSFHSPPPSLSLYICLLVLTIKWMVYFPELKLNFLITKVCPLTTLIKKKSWSIVMDSQNFTLSWPVHYMMHQVQTSCEWTFILKYSFLPYPSIHFILVLSLLVGIPSYFLK